MEVIAAILLSFLPAFFYGRILYWLDRYEKEPFWLITGAFIWGAVIATLGAIFFGLILQVGVYLLTSSEVLSNVVGTVIIAPLVEESLKGIAILLIFLLFKSEFDSILDGIVYAGIVGLGFAATENVLYLLSSYQESGWEGLWALFVLRVILGAWGHAVYAAFIGIGIGITRLTTNSFLKIVAPIGGWMMAVFVHAVHNGMAVFLGGTLGLGGLVALLIVDWLSWIVMFFIIVWAISRERRWIAEYLHEEVQNGLITPEQYRVAQSSWAQTRARFRALFVGRRRTIGAFYQMLAELAQKKHQLAIHGEERGNSARIRQLRQDIAQLAPSIVVR